MKLDPDEIRATLTPPEVAERFRVSADKVRHWITAGQLRAIDVSTHPGTGKPRWRIHPTDLIAFENLRTVTAPAKPTRRRRKAIDVIEYFK